MLYRLRPDQGVPAKQVPSVTNARKDAARDALHFSIGCWRWPHGRRGVFPVPARETQGEPSTVCDQRVGEVPPVVRCKSDNSHHAAGLDQIGEPGKPFFGIHVMKGGDRHHGVERTSLEGNVKNVALPPLDRDASVARPRSVEYLPRPHRARSRAERRSEPTAPRGCRHRIPRPEPDALRAGLHR